MWRGMKDLHRVYCEVGMFKGGGDRECVLPPSGQWLGEVCSTSMIYASDNGTAVTHHGVYRAPSRMPLTSGTDVKSAKKGMRSVSSAS